MTSPGHWWAQWAAHGIAIAWFLSLLRVIRAAIIMGGLAALAAYVLHRWQVAVQPDAGPRWPSSRARDETR